MKHTKLLLIFILAFVAVGLMAIPATPRFTDTTTGTYDLVSPQYFAQNNANYPAGAGNITTRWEVRAYLSTDAVIDPLSVTGLPTGNDTYLSSQPLNFSPGTGHTLNIQAVSILDGVYPCYVYLRIFNSIQGTAPTKHMTMHAAYAVTVGGPISVPIIPTYGWPTPAWVDIAPPSDTYQLTVTSNVPGMIATGAAVAVGQATPWVSAQVADVADLVGTYSMTAIPGGTWAPASIEVVAGDFVTKADYTKTINFTWTADIYNYTLYVAGPAGYSVAGPDGPMPFPAMFVAPDTDMENELLGTYTPVGAAPVGFRWEPASIDVTEGMFSAGKAALVQGSRSASSKATYNYVANISFEFVPVYNCPEGVETPLYPGITITMITGNANYAPGQPPTAPINPLFTQVGIQFFTLVGPGPWLLQFNTTSEWVWVVGYGVFAGPGLISVPIPASKDEIIEAQFGNGGNPTLPVELSSFTAVLTANNFVKLTWVSQSETEMLGYRVYRGESGDQASAIMITPTMIGATNTSTTQSYSITDNEVSIGSTYWYWLESVDYASSHFHGPVSIIVEGEVPPVLPEVTSMKNAYPNPFRMNSSTNIEVAVKAGENGIVTIYNILGQAVKTFKVSEGTTKINWNGRDAKGNACGSGIYFYKLSTPSMNQTKKMVIVK